MEHRLSIIIPCYNCAETLEEAVDSIYRQALTLPFEIIMVDDCSTDKTVKIMDKLKNRYKETKVFNHEKNQGGGVTRNTAVEKSTGDIIFCLDSDDILGDGALNKMVNYLLAQKCDAVGVSTSIKFKGKNIKDIDFVNNFGYVGEKIPTESLFNPQKCSLYSVFMFTKRAFKIAGGYPTEHGFDTQGFAWRFLANGLTAYTCPDTTYYHRVSFHRSYYIREYESGKTNHNWLKIFEEFLYLFKIEIRQKILMADLNNLNQHLIDLIGGRNGFRQDYQTFILPEAKRHYEDLIKTAKESDTTDYYWLGTKKLSEGQKTEALSYFAKSFERGLRNDHLYEKLLSLNYQFHPDEKEKAKKAARRITSYQKHGKALFLPTRIFQKIKHIILNGFKKYTGIINARWNASPNKKLFIYWLILRFKKILKIDFRTNCAEADKESIDIVIPTISKDQELLGLVIPSLAQICQPINKIYIVSPENDFIKNFCIENNCQFVEEKSVLGYDKNNIDYKVDNLNLGGWFFQQLLKLSGDKFVEKKNYFVLDSDTILLNQHNLIQNNKFILFENEEWNDLYFKNFKKIFGYQTQNRLSFTSHMMIFNVDYLKEMKEELEKKHHKDWDMVYRSTIEQGKESCISDYDTYANWLLIRHPDRIITKPLYNRSIKRDQLKNLKERINILKKKYNSISFHSHYLKSREEVIKEINQSYDR